MLLDVRLSSFSGCFSLSCSKNREFELLFRPGDKNNGKSFQKSIFILICSNVSEIFSFTVSQVAQIDTIPRELPRCRIKRALKHSKTGERENANKFNDLPKILPIDKNLPSAENYNDSILKRS